MNTNPNHRIGIYAALLLIAGIVLSGPLGLIVVTTAAPPARLAGCADTGGQLPSHPDVPILRRLSAGHWLRPADRHAVSALRRQEQSRCHARRHLHGGVYGLIFLNYICQTTFIPALLANYRPEYATIVAAFSFANPGSLCWAIEMWGYALLGLATLLLAPVFNRGSWVEKTTAWLMILNGILSIIGGFITAVHLTWVMTPVGLANYVVWNILVVVLGVFVILALSQREQLLHVPAAAALPPHAQNSGLPTH